MRALITGMTGFVGGHLVGALLLDGCEVHGTLLPAVPERAPTGTTGHPVDIADPGAMADLIGRIRPEVVFHLAGSASVGQSFADPSGTWHVNVEGTRGVLEAVRRVAPAARVVVALSGEQYGRVPMNALPVTENTPLHPISPYGESKAAADHLCAEYVRKHDLAVLRVRAFNHIGPGQDPRFVVPSICKQIADAEISGERVCRLRLGNIDTRRDFLDVRDVVSAYRLVAERGDPARVYLAATGRSVSVRELVEFLVSLAEVPVTLVSDPGRVREGEQTDLYADPHSLKSLGWKAQIPIETSLTDCLAYWRSRAHTEIG